jgi:hypothetical protein
MDRGESSLLAGKERLDVYDGVSDLTEGAQRLCVELGDGVPGSRWFMEPAHNGSQGGTWRCDHGRS